MSPSSHILLLADTIAPTAGTGPAPFKAEATHLIDAARTAVANHNGVSLSLDNHFDFFAASFSDAQAALAAALAIHEHWCADGTATSAGKQPRVALHAASEETPQHMTFGSAFNRARHLLQACRPGQLLLSQSVVDLLGEKLPARITLTGLGRRRLKDLLPAEHLFAAIAPCLPDIGGSPATLDTYLTNLPIQPTPFLGRMNEVAAIRARLSRDEQRLVTLTAPSGIGKTRFALEVAAGLLDVFSDGVFFISLAPIDTPELVIPTIARILGIKESGTTSVLENLQTYLSERKVLLVLDNIEQVVDAAHDIGALLAATQHLRILVTSHIPLQLPCEHVVAVPPLAVPESTASPPLEQIISYDAIILFVERIQAVNPAFVLDAQNAPTIVEICRCAGGVPLAIELVAACGEQLSPTALLEQLLAWKEPSTATLTLSQVLDWSYTQLEPSAQIVLARLGVFVEGCTLEAAEVVCQAGDNEPIDVLNEVGTLLRRNLLLEEELAGGDPRYIMLDCVHEYAWAKLVARGEREDLQHRHAAYYCAARKTFVDGLRGPEQPIWLNRLEGEHNNIRAALRWALERGDSLSAVHLCLGIWIFWYLRGYWREGREWLVTVLAIADATPAEERAYLNFATAILHATLGYSDRSKMYNERALALFREIDDKLHIATILNNFGVDEIKSGQHAEAKAHFIESLAVQREIPQAIDLNALTPMNLGVIAIEEQDYEAAQRYFDEAVAAARRLDEKRVTVATLCTMGVLQLIKDDLPAATAYFREGLQLSRELGGFELSGLLDGAAWIAVAHHQPLRAARLLGAAEAFREAIGQSHSILARGQRYELLVADAQAQTDPEAFANAWTEGRAMGSETAITFALDELV